MGSYLSVELGVALASALLSILGYLLDVALLGFFGVVCAVIAGTLVLARWLFHRDGGRL
jgi:uncharacterized membrane protein YbaN (DUF454 family)